MSNFDKPTYKPNLITMKKFYLFFFICAIYPKFQAQNTACAAADSFLIYAYSNVKDAYESNNVQHLKYYAEKSLKSFEEAKPHLKTCGCDAAFELAFNAKELIKKVEATSTFEDARFFVKRAKEITQNCITELNKCTIPNYNETIEIAKIEENGVNDLKTLQKQKDQLEQQRLALKIKEDELLKKLDTQKNKELQLQKETLIKDHKVILNLNISMCNKVLKTYGSLSKIDEYTENDASLLSENIKTIKSYYLNITKNINNDYLEKLNLCQVN
ncbi:MAG: hypothetical protein GW839_06695 [Flavobacteriales bacterium]|nr:hypothetical protein [Flavobacteriia bacterium]NCP05554.1 hypothetical protein [Flavobacteriales bacterium]NCP51779.1 hypothetical protein [Flavobacteriales bacterium]NCP59975.1 hypothetical protein [Flavobacteriales bacterium]NCP90650.1 hypothetical protein [Flavobacteriales bacterium]